MTCKCVEFLQDPKLVRPAPSFKISSNSHTQMNGLDIRPRVTYNIKKILS